MVLQNHLINKNHHISTDRVPLATKLGGMITYLNGFQPIKSHDPLSRDLFRPREKLKPLSITIIVPMATKFDRMVINFERLPNVKS